MKQITSAVSSVSVTLLICIALLFGANWLAEDYLRANPEILMTREQRINENTRAVREAMIPKDKITEWYDLESPDEMLAMWSERYHVGVEFESYVHFKARAFEGKYYGTTDAGYRKARDPGPWPVDEKNFNIFFFGGSTAFGVGPYWATVASYLQQELNADGKANREIKVYNFGRSGYFTGQEIVLFQRLLTNGNVPDMVVFLDGLNDFCWVDGQPSSWQMLARHFNSVNAAAAEQAINNGVVTEWRTLKSFFEKLPLTRYVNAVISRAVEEPQPQYTGPAKAVADKPESEETLQAIIDRYLSFKTQVEGIAVAFGIVPVFVWQPIPTYKYDTAHHLFNPDRLGCHINSKFGYPMMAKRIEEMKGLGPNFIWTADIQENLKEPLYVDAFHYNAPMSKRLAKSIADTVKERSLLAVKEHSD